MIKLPNKKKFIFTIIDDTDDAFSPKIDKVYDVLIDNGLKTTKTVWVYPVRDIERSKGHCLQNKKYIYFIIKIKSKGFEIGLHNVGSGSYERHEIIDGLKEYQNIIGENPKIHVNHSYNPDNIYCGPKRFSFPFNLIVKYLYSSYNNFSGEIKKSKYFWGDLHKKMIMYSRNYEIDNINTYKYNKYMPYKDRIYDEFVITNSQHLLQINQCLTTQIKNLLINLKMKGVRILYTHLGYYCEW